MNIPKPIAYTIIVCFVLSGLFPTLVLAKLKLKDIEKFDTIMTDCVYATIRRFHANRIVTLFTNEVRDSIGEELLIRGIGSSVDINYLPVGDAFNHGRIFLLQPRWNITSFKLYDFILSKIEKGSYFLIIWPENTNTNIVTILHSMFWDYRILRVASFIPTNLGFDIYTYFPYSEKTCGSASKIKRVDKCTSQGFKTNFNVFNGINKLLNFYKCNISCFGNNQYPESVLARGSNGTWEAGGTIAYMLSTFRSHYNVSLAYTNIFNDTHGWFYYNTSMQTDLNSGNSTYEFGFGVYTILNALNNPEMEYCFPSNPECISWAIPKHAGKYIPLWTIYWIEFSLVVWCVLISIIITMAAIIAIIWKVEGRRISLLKEYKLVTIIFFSMMGHMPVLKSRLISMQILLFQWGACAVAIRCAYEASLGSLMTIPIPVKQISSHKELLDKDFRVSGGIRMYDLLKSSSNSSKILESLLARFEIQEPTDGEEVFNDLYDNRNLAVLQPSRYAIYKSREFAKKRGLTSLSTVMKPCLVTTFTASLIIRKGSIMSQLLYTFSNRVFESGLMEFWKNIDMIREEKLDKEPVSITLHKLYGAFIIFGIGISLAIAVFVSETIFNKKPQLRSDKNNIEVKILKSRLMKQVK